MTAFNSLSEVQKLAFKSLSGYEYDGKSMTAHFETDRPYDADDWRLSAWIFSFVFDTNTGYLYCELDHRMTNNRVSGWDQDGKELGPDLLEKVFPAHF